MMKLIDIGANLLDEMFQGVYNGKKRHEPDYAELFQRAEKVGVDKIIVTAGSVDESREAVGFVEKWGATMAKPELYTTVGVHPTRCNEFEGPDSKTIADLLAINAPGKVVAIGEIGLDYERQQFCLPDTQKKWFETQLCDLSDHFKLPLFLHMREAAEDFLDIMSRNRSHWEGQGGVVHSFTGTPDDVQHILSLGLSIGINGRSLKTEENVNAVKLIPDDKLLLETDAPYCEIRPSFAAYKGQPAEAYKKMNEMWPEVKKEKFAPGLRVKSRNEPCGMLPVLAAVAQIRGVSKEQLADLAYENTEKLFHFNH